VCSSDLEVFERVHYFVGREHEAVITQFCSKECEDQHSGVDARIKEMVEREVRTELNLMRKFMCPKDLQRFKRYVE
jgi:hypothetical protein